MEFMLLLTQLGKIEMSAETVSKKIEKPSPRTKVLKVGAGLASALALSGLAYPQSARAERVTSGTVAAQTREHGSPMKPETHSRLKNISELAGFGKKVTAEQLETIKQSTVKLLIRERLSNNPWSEWCTGVKISYQSKEYIVTAAHCLSLITGDKWGTMKGGSYGYPDAKAMDVSSPELSNWQFAVGDPSLSPSDRELNPLAVIENISVSLEDQDMALMTVAGGSSPSPNKGGSSFQDIPAIPYQVLTRQSLPGQEVGQVGVPYDSGSQMLTATGIYLGTVKSPNFHTEGINGKKMFDGTYRTVAVTAINAPSPTTDECRFGSSGSGAILADGSLRFSLTLRASVGYGKWNKVFPPDDSITRSRSDWAFYEKALGVKVPTNKFNILCFYDDPGKDTFDNLVAGIGNYYAPLPKK